MQRPLETLIYKIPELGTVQPPGNAGAIGIERPADSFSNHMYTATSELPTEFTGDLSHPLAGTSLPSAGSTLPAEPEDQLFPPSFADLSSHAEPVSQSLMTGFLDRHLPSAEIVDTDQKANSPGALSLVADVQANISNNGEADPVPQGPAEDIANAGIFTATLQPVVSPVPVIPRPQDNRPTDSRSQIRREVTKSAISKPQGNPGDTANRVIQELAKQKIPTETHAATPPLSSGAPPPAQLTAATLALGGIGPGPLVAATTLTTAIGTPVLDPAWADALQDRILWLAGKNIQAAEIRLNPAELGPLKVQISVDDKSTHILFSASHAVTRDALEIALPRLKDMLAENGMSLTNASVSDQEIANQRNHSDQGNPADTALSDEESTQAVSDLLPNRVAIKDPLSLVDTYV